MNCLSYFVLHFLNPKKKNENKIFVSNVCISFEQTTKNENENNFRYMNEGKNINDNILNVLRYTKRTFFPFITFFFLIQLLV